MSSTPDKSIFNRHLKGWQVLFILVPCLFLIYRFSLIYFTPDVVPWIFAIEKGIGGMLSIGLAGVALFGIHAVVLWSLGETSSTRLRRGLNSLLLLLLAAMALWIVFAEATGWRIYPGGLRWHESGPYLGIAMFVFIVARGLISLSLSSSFLGLAPLLVFYSVAVGLAMIWAFFLGQWWFWGPVEAGLPLLTIPLFALSVYLFPMHRRMAKEWRPKRLPRLPKSRRSDAGLTLIELLIFAAMIAIFVPAIARLTSQAHLTLERQTTRRAALEYVRDEVALLRGREMLPAPGVYPPSDEMIEIYPFIGKSEFEIRPGPLKGLSEVEITIRLAGEYDVYENSFIVLIGDPAL